MNVVIRALLVYVFALVIMRISGRRTFGEMTAFDLVLLLIISEATTNAIIGDNYSLTNSFLAIATLVGADIALSLLKRRSGQMAKWLDGTPTIIVQDGTPLRDRMYKARIDDEDVLTAARRSRGIESMSQIRFAVLEADGKISIIPKEPRSLG